MDFSSFLLYTIITKEDMMGLYWVLENHDRNVTVYESKPRFFKILITFQFFLSLTTIRIMLIFCSKHVTNCPIIIAGYRGRWERPHLSVQFLSFSCKHLAIYPKLRGWRAHLGDPRSATDYIHCFTWYVILVNMCKFVMEIKSD